MATKGSVQHYKLDVLVDDEWFGNDLVFSNRAQAKAYGEGLRECGAIDEYALSETNAPIKYPPDGYREDTEAEGSPSDNGGPVLLPSDGDGLDWDALLDVMILCPSLFCSAHEDYLGSIPLAITRAIHEELCYLEAWDAY